MTDDFEDLYGLNRNDPSDAALDPDGDGQTNLQEFQAGTQPNNPASALRISLARLSPDGGRIELQFQGVHGRGYSLWRRTLIGNDAWQKTGEVLNAPSDQMFQVTDPILPGDTQKFYQLRLNQ